MKIVAKKKGDAGSAQEQTSPQRQRVGTEGNVIEELPGEQLTREETINEYIESFGDIDLDDIEVDDGIFEDIANKPEVREDNTTTDGKPKETISPDGREKKEPVVEPDEEEESGDEDEGADDGQQPPADSEYEEVDLDNYVPKEQYEELESKLDEVQGELNNLKGKVNPALEKMSQEDIRLLNQVHHDIQHTPLGLIADMYYKDELNLDSLITEKPVTAYMPKDAEYSQEEAMTLPDSPSWKARIEWETDRANKRRKVELAGKDASAELKNRSKQLTPEEQEAEEQKMFQQLESKVPQSAKHMPIFKKWFDQQPNLLIPLYYAFASQAKAIQSRGGRKIKSSVESKVKSSGGSTKTTKKTTVDDQLRNEFGD